MFEFRVAQAGVARDGSPDAVNVNGPESETEGPIQEGPRVLLFPSPQRSTASINPEDPQAEAPTAADVPDPGSRSADPGPILPSAERRAPGADLPDPGPRSADPGPILPSAERRALTAGSPDPGSRIPDPDKYRVVWWDPHSLVLQAPVVGGLRRDDLIAKDGDQPGVERRMGEYRAWQADRAAAVDRGGRRQASFRRRLPTFPAIARCRRGQTTCRSR